MRKRTWVSSASDREARPPFVLVSGSALASFTGSSTPASNDPGAQLEQSTADG